MEVLAVIAIMLLVAMGLIVHWVNMVSVIDYNEYPDWVLQGLAVGLAIAQAGVAYTVFGFGVMVVLAFASSALHVSFTMGILHANNMTFRDYMIKILDIVIMKGEKV